MDEAAARRVLEEMLPYARTYAASSSSSAGGYQQWKAAESEVNKRLWGVTQILKSLGLGLPSGRREIPHFVELAIGRIDDRERINEIVGPTGPALSVTSLHDSVWAAASPFWPAGFYPQAVGAAWKVVEARIRERSGRRDLSGADLIKQVFSSSEAKPGQPRLRPTAPASWTDSTKEGLLEGARGLGQAAVALARNVEAHEEWELLEDEALEYLAMLSALARIVETADILTVPESAASPQEPGNTGDSG